jgi:deoxyribodipyrimidine photo-lyase
MKTIIVWFRNDLRLLDNPALATACNEADQIVPLFIFDQEELMGRHASSNRNRFLLESLTDIKTSLKKCGANLVIRSGKPEDELIAVARETDTSAVYYIAGFAPDELQRDKRVKSVLDSKGIEFRSFPGQLAVSGLNELNNKSGQAFKVFTPFWKTWQQVQRRPLAETPKSFKLPTKITLGTLPKLSDITNDSDLSPDVFRGGESEALSKLNAFLNDDVTAYNEVHNDLAADKTSHLSPYLHFGCLSARYIETQIPDSDGARAWHRQLAWREFYAYILFRFPKTLELEFQEKYHKLSWDNEPKLIIAWQSGHTGYPIVDAAMRQLNKEGYMHNRGRLIVGSFLTKDLWLDWREGADYFMKMLLDGDEANNTGNWQWIASVGVDPAPVYRRLYNPSSQLKNFDQDGIYTRRYVPELKNVPNKYLSEPWTMSTAQQEECGCIIGKDYPAPIVDHKSARLAALEQYRSIS